VNTYLSAELRRLTIAITVPVVILITAASGSATPGGTSATPVATAAATTTGVTMFDSPGLHTFGVIAAGAPGFDLPGDNEIGAVDLFLTDGSVQILTERKLGLVQEYQSNFNRFGTAVAVADLNADGYPDLVVGAPGDRLDGSTPGHVDVLLGSAEGITSQGATILASPAKTGDEFGTALAISDGTLWIGAPGTDTSGTGTAGTGTAGTGTAGTGAVYRYSIDSSGKATEQGISTDASLGNPTLQAGERFGEVLAPTSDGVIVGVPQFTIGSTKAAGQIVQLHLAGKAITAERWNQNSPGVPGTAEAGDHFGAAVSTFGLAVGIPGEDVGKLTDAGSVQNFTLSKAGNHLIPAASLTQDSKGIPGIAEAGDKFGAALSYGTYNCHEVWSVAIGSPGEDLGKARDAGSVTLVPRPDSSGSGCPAVLLNQDHGLPGTAETGDAVGQTLGTQSDSPDLEEDAVDGLLIGAPGEDVGTAKSGRDVGRVTRWSSLGAPQTFGFQGGDRPSQQYGAVLATKAL